MKKAFYLFSGLLGVFVSSCKKDYNCNCKYGIYTYNVPGMDIDVEASKEAEAKDACKANWISAFASYGGYTTAEAEQTYNMYIICSPTKK